MNKGDYIALTILVGVTGGFLYLTKGKEVETQVASQDLDGDGNIDNVVLRHFDGSEEAGDMSIPLHTSRLFVVYGKDGGGFDEREEIAYFSNERITDVKIDDVNNDKLPDITFKLDDKPMLKLNKGYKLFGSTTENFYK